MSEEESSRPSYWRHFHFKTNKRSPHTYSIDDDKSLNNSFVSNNQAFRDRDYDKSSMGSIEEIKGSKGAKSKKNIRIFDKNRKK